MAELVGRDEPRDFLDVLEIHEQTLSLGALCWAAAGKDPGFTPSGLLDLLKRRGKYHAEDFARLQLKAPPDLVALKQSWLAALDQAQRFIDARPPAEIGCLYYSPQQQEFVRDAETGNLDAVPHYGRPGGVLPTIG